jgi:hypothetical protein
MKKLNFILLVLIIIVMFSCKKSDNQSSSQSSENCKLLKSLSSYTNYTCYYNEDNTISKSMFVASPGDTVWDYYYYESGHVNYMIRLMQGEQADTATYVYSAGKYTEVHQYGSVYKFSYDSRGNMIKLSIDTGTQYYDYCDFNYDAKGNCIKFSKYYWSGTAYFLAEITEFEYGTNKNPYYSIGLPPLNSMNYVTGQYQSLNNITKIKDHIYDYTVMNFVYVYNYSSFNENAYPLNVTTSDSLGHPLSYENLSYKCP